MLTEKVCISWKFKCFCLKKNNLWCFLLCRRLWDCLFTGPHYYCKLEIFSFPQFEGEIFYILKEYGTLTDYNSNVHCGLHEESSDG